MPGMTPEQFDADTLTACHRIDLPHEEALPLKNAETLARQDGSKVDMNFYRFCSRAFFATAFVAINALPSWASAQNLPLNLTGQAAAGPVVVSEQVRAELLVYAPQGVVPGQPVWVGLQLAHQPGWHSYWKNSGDSGLPTRLEWTLPAGVSAGDIAWPTPQKHWLGTLANYGYKNTVLLPVALTVAPGFSAAQLDIKLQASWLICKDVCIPQDGEFALRLPAQGSSSLSSAAFEAAFAAAPRALPTGSSQIEVAGSVLKVSLSGLPAALQGKTLEFFPETGGVIEPGAAWQQAWQGNLWTAQIPLSGQRTESPARLPAVVALASQAGAAGWRFEAPVQGSWPAVAVAAYVPAALDTALKANAAGGAAPLLGGAAQLTLMAALLGALLGGMILNLMHCVFPVLAIKIVGFVQVHDRKTRATAGLAYTAGVLLSFLALGALLLALRAAGEQLGWGFQLQSPVVVAVFAALFTVLGLNLAGLFDFGQLLPSRVASLQARSPTLNSFLSGVLAAAIASPCTAPFMGAALGLAVVLPTAQALAVFASVGLGMALPYLLVSLIPGLAKVLPRPGAWMVTFRRAMAFPMFATVVWLVWILGQQSGIDGVGALLGLLVLLAFAIWTFTLAGRTRRVSAIISVALGVWAVWAGGQYLVKPLEVSAAVARTDRWQPWEPGRVEQFTAEGRSVMVDFTAAWCVTCQYNKKTTLQDSAVLADMDAKKVVLLRADWTRRDPAITAALKQLGRSGVPVYAIYKPGSPPVLLSEILSVADVRRELAKL